VITVPSKGGPEEVVASYHRRILREMIAKKIAGDILFSSDIGLAMRKWRQYFGIKQSELARTLEVSASVISDYESGRRRSPGSLVLRRFVEALLELDEKKGGTVTKTLARTLGISDMLASVIDIRELATPVETAKFVKVIDGEVLVQPPGSQYIYGYTVIDSVKAIEMLSGADFMRLFGSSTERALIFTKVSTGRSPMVAIRVFDVRPALVVLHGLTPESVDPLAIKLAKLSNVGLVVSKLPDVGELVERLRASL